MDKFPEALAQQMRAHDAVNLLHGDLTAAGLGHSMSDIMKNMMIAAMLAGSEILAAYYRIGQYKDIDIQTKKDGSFVTEMDLRAQKIIHDFLGGKYPDTAFVGEESNTPQSFESKASLWIADPIDGTKNFINKNVHYVVTLARQAHNDEDKLVTTESLIYAPSMAKMIWANAGGAYEHSIAYINSNCRTLSVAHWRDKSSNFLGSFRLFGTDPNMKKLRAVMGDVLTGNGITLHSSGSTAWGLVSIADLGRDGSVIIGKNLNVWDIEAARFIAEKAGAISIQQKVQLFEEDYNALITANNQKLLDILNGALQGMLHEAEKFIQTGQPPHTFTQQKLFTAPPQWKPTES